MADLAALIERVEALTGPSRDAARQIQCTIGGWHRITPSQCGNKRGGYIAPEDWIGRRADGQPILDSLHGTTIWPDAPDVTASLDAAIALVKRVLPGWGISLGIGIKPFGAGVWKPGALGPQYSSNHPVTPIALALAALRALHAQEERDG